MFTGIIPIAKDEDGLAVILGHGRSRGIWERNARVKLIFSAILDNYRNRTSSRTALG